MFIKSPEGFYLAEPLTRIDWLTHGFGTRASSAVEGRLATVRQIHSGIAVEAGANEGCVGEGDALYSNSPSTTVGVKTADCVPVLLVDVRHRAVAAVHAGWRGTLADIVTTTLRAMSARYGTVAQDVQAAIGPSIGPCCYEVGPEVAMRFSGLFPERDGLDARTTIDLSEANRRLLERCGVPRDQIFSAGLCTMCMAGDFHSFRRDRDRAGRMLSIIGVR